MKNIIGKHSRTLVFLAALALVALAAQSAFAQGKKKKATPEIPVTTEAQQGDAEGGGKEGDDQTKVKVERGAGGKKVYKIEGEIVIEGKIQKPEAFYVLQKSSINYDWHELKQEFLPKILDSVTKAPF